MKTKLTIVFALLCVPSLWCQETSKVEVFGGYSYLNVDTNKLTSRQNANGWEASVDSKMNNWFAVEGDFSGYYKSGIDASSVDIFSASLHDFAFAAGPRIEVRPLFFHALAGVSHLTGTDFGFSRSQNSFAGAFGGGVQWKVAPQWAVRVSADYVLTHHNLPDLLDISTGSTMRQNNYRVSVGVVYLFGSARRSASVSPEGRPVAPQPCETVSQSPILGMAGCTTDIGLKVTSVQPGSLGAQAGINPGDIVVRIDGRPVQNGRAVDAAIAASQTGTIRISYLIQASWLTERELKVR